VQYSGRSFVTNYVCNIVRVHLPEFIDEVDAVVPLVESKTVLNAYSIGACVVWNMKKNKYLCLISHIFVYYLHK